MSRRARRADQILFWTVHGLASLPAVGGLLTAAFLLAVVLNAALNAGAF